MPNLNHNMDDIFHPRSVAFAGITLSDPNHWTRNFLKGLLAFKFPGPIYLVNPRGGEIDGLKVYEKFSDIPGNVDYVISTVPAKASPELVLDCAAKGVKAIHFCTSGFSETGIEEAKQLEIHLAEAGRQTGVRIIGPNCMGIYNPEARLTFRSDFPMESGPVGLICQSGGNAITLIKRVEYRGVRFSKAISHGNACDLDESDYLEYLTADPSTRIIAMYIEGIKDGKKFRRALEKATMVKPVVLLKGGVTEDGARAAAGHTASLAGSGVAWRTLCKQLGVLWVNSVEELADILVTLTFMPEPAGRRVALVGAGGGSSVLVTDEFSRQGLIVPPLPERLRQQILEFTPPAGNILRNPIDYSQSMTNTAGLTKTMQIVSHWDEVDLIIWFTSLMWNQDILIKRLPAIVKGVLDEAKTITKPLAMVLEPSIAPDEAKLILPFIQLCASRGFPVYYSFASAATAIDRVLKYNDWRRTRSANNQGAV